MRLVRAIEIAEAIGRVPKIKFESNKNYKFLEIGLVLDQAGLTEKIHARLLKRIKQGMIAEVRKLKAAGVSWRRLYAMGLEYRFVSEHLQGKLAKDEMINLLETAIRQYAKRQMTWFTKDKRIKWFDPKDQQDIESEVGRFLEI